MGYGRCSCCPLPGSPLPDLIPLMDALLGAELPHEIEEFRTYPFLQGATGGRTHGARPQACTMENYRRKTMESRLCCKLLSL